MIGGGVEDGIDKNQGFYMIATGLTMDIVKKVSLVTEVKAIRKADNTTDIETNVGLGFKFGNNPKNQPIQPNTVTPLPTPQH